MKNFLLIIFILLVIIFTSILLYKNTIVNNNKEEKFKLADLYYKSDSSIDNQQAFKLFEELYNNNKRPFPCSNIVLGNMFYTGKGTEKNIEKALKLWENDTCEKVNTDNNDIYINYSKEAFEHLFEYLTNTKQTEALYQEGLKCLEYHCSHKIKDNSYFCDKSEQAYKWFVAAADNGHLNSKFYVALIQLNELLAMSGCFEGEQLSNDELEKILLSLVKQGHTGAMEVLASIYITGGFMYGDDFYSSGAKYRWGDDNITDLNFEKGVHLHEQAFNSGDYYAAIELGLVYEYEKDLKKAEYWYKKAKEKGVEIAEECLNDLGKNKTQLLENKYGFQEYLKTLKDN